MDILGILSNVGFDWHVFLFNLVNFLVLLFLLKKFLFDKVVAIIDERERIIKEGLDNARLAQEQLDNAEAKRKEIITDAKNRRDEMYKEAIEEAKSISEEIKNEAIKESQQMVEKANLQANRAKEKILEDVKKNVSDIVTKELESKITKN